MGFGLIILPAIHMRGYTAMQRSAGPRPMSPCRDSNPSVGTHPMGSRSVEVRLRLGENFFDSWSQGAEPNPYWSDVLL